MGAHKMKLGRLESKAPNLRGPSLMWPTLLNWLDTYIQVVYGQGVTIVKNVH